MYLRKLYLIKIIPIFVLSFTFFGCNGNGTSDDYGLGSIAVFIHDKPADYDEVNIQIDQVAIISEEDGEQEVITEEEQNINILEYINGDKYLLGENDVKEGNYNELNVIFGESHSLVLNGEHHDVEIEDEREYSFDINANIQEDDQYTLNIDFNPIESIQDEDGYFLEPELRVYKESETVRVSGQVVPEAAHSRIKIKRGQSLHTSTKTEESTGEFQLMGIEPGIYNVEITPVSDVYSSAYQSNLILQEEGSTVDIGTYGLDQSRLIGDESWNKRILDTGVELLQRHDEINGQPRYISILAIDLDNESTDVGIFTPYFFGNDPHRMPISEYGERSHALAATNAGFAPGGDDYHNYGIIKVDGEVLPYVQKGTSDYFDEILEDRMFMGSSAFGIDEDNNWSFRKREGETWDDDWPEVKHAIAGGHMVLNNGEITETISQRQYDSSREENHVERQHPRTAVCKTSDRVAAIFAIDGRHNEAVGMSLMEMADFMLELGCVDAINYDGGGSTTMWTEQHGVVNHPTDNDEFDNEGQRDLRNALIIRTQ